MRKLTAQKAGAAPRGFWGIAAPAFSDCLPREEVSSYLPGGFLFRWGPRPGYPGPSYVPSAGITSDQTDRRRLRAVPSYRAVPGAPPGPERPGFRTGGL